MTRTLTRKSQPNRPSHNKIRITGLASIPVAAGKCCRQPLTIDGQRIGTLCIIDQKPRQFKSRNYDSLKCLANWVEVASWKTDKSLLAFDGEHDFTIFQYSEDVGQDDPVAYHQRALVDEFSAIPTLKFNVSAIQNAG